MAFDKADIENFKSLNLAILNDQAKMVRCKDKKTGKDVIVVAAVFEEHGEHHMVPLFKAFDGDPYEELEPSATFEAVSLDNGNDPENAVEFPSNKD